MRRQAEPVASAEAERGKAEEARREEELRRPAAAGPSKYEEWTRTRRRAYGEMVEVFFDALKRSGRFGQPSRLFPGRYVWNSGARVWCLAT